MPKERIQLADVIPASPEQIYQAWLDPTKHGAMTFGRATADGSGVGARFTAGDDYIWGEHLELVPNQRIVQAWSTTEFPPDCAPSRLEVLLEQLPEGTRLTLVHSDIPEGQGARYEGGWRDYYFTPMKKFFGENGKAPAAAAKPEPAKAAAPVKEKAAAAAAPKAEAKPKAKPAARAKAKAKPKAKPAAKAKAKAKPKAKPAAKAKAKAKPAAKAKAKPKPKAKAKAGKAAPKKAAKRAPVKAKRKR